MKLYAGIDLHSNNSVVSVIDEHDRVVAEKRLPNELERIVLFLAAFKQALVGIVVESTFNWYWLVDGLMEAGYRVHLANPAAMQQYEGIKHTGDEHDARWLAHLLRLEILPEGYIYPRQARGVRDLMRRRMQLVDSRSQQLLAMQTQLMRSRGHSMRVVELKALELEQIEALVKGERNLASALRANLAVAQVLDRADRAPGARDPGAGQAAPPSSSRCCPSPGWARFWGCASCWRPGRSAASPGWVTSPPMHAVSIATGVSNGKKKGAGNAKCGNRYLAWAFVEAAHFAVRYNARIKRFYERKAAKTNSMVAIKAVAHKLARAAYHIMRTHERFEEARAFA